MRTKPSISSGDVPVVCKQASETCEENLRAALSAVALFPAAKYLSVLNERHSGVLVERGYSKNLHVLSFVPFFLARLMTSYGVVAVPPSSSAKNLKYCLHFSMNAVTSCSLAV